MVLTLIQQGLGLRPREKRALCGKMNSHCCVIVKQISLQVQTDLIQSRDTPSLRRSSHMIADLTDESLLDLPSRSVLECINSSKKYHCSLLLAEPVWMF